MFPRDEAMQDREGKFVKTRWVQPVKGDNVRCRLVAQEFAKGDPRVRPLRWHASSSCSKDACQANDELAGTKMGLS